MTHALILAGALILDALLGEPERLWSRVPHPAVLMGRAVGWAEARMNHGRGRIGAGIVALIALVILAGLIGWGLAQLGWVIELVVVAVLLAHRSLADHVSEVADALDQSTTAGRRAVARIVGRDTADMDDDDIARAAIESAAENFSDGVIAPAFWFLVAGLPGIAIYKMVNTADSMIGYRTPRHEQFGKAAARLDDVLNWVPARLTAGLILLTKYRPGSWRLVRQDAPLHRSPNAGWPEAAMAINLDVALAGPRSYNGTLRPYPFVNETGERVLGASDIDRAVSVLWRVWAVVLGIVLIISVVW